MSPLPPSWYGKYILSTSACLANIQFIHSCFLVILSRSCIPSSFQFITTQLYDTTGTASVLIAAILFLALSSDLSTSLILFLYSFRILAIILWWSVPFPSSMPRYVYVVSCSRSCMTLLSFNCIPSADIFFPLLNVALAHLPRIKFNFEIWHLLDSVH